MPNMNSRSLVTPPGSKKSRDILFGVWVVPRPPGGAFEGMHRVRTLESRIL
jgi:hypothetical protein